MLENVKPEKVFAYFEDICKIPHGSGNTFAISEYCVKFAKSHGFLCYRDELNNVLIKKKGSVGYEDHPPVILQGHLDMVCEKDEGIEHDFLKDPLRLEIDGDFITAKGTTLGGDDGIAVASVLAILDDDTLSHPPIEALFTVDEETGMYGADGFDTSMLSGKTLINIDSEEEGVLTVSCAGGARVDVTLPLVLEKNNMPCKTVTVSGLMGGHSGIMINEGRLNANSVMGKLLANIPADFRLVSVKGGSKDNVISPFCECVIACNEDISDFLSEFEDKMRVPADNGLEIVLKDAEKHDMCLDRDTTNKITGFLDSLVYGVTAMSKDIPGLVQSSQNPGIVSTDDGIFHATISVRSSVAEEKQQLLDNIETLAKECGADFSTRGHYPAWEYRKESILRDTMVKVFKKIYGKSPEICAIHAGLECGLFGGKIADLDAVSIGPDVFDVHSPKEKLSVSSVRRTYEYVCKVLEEL